MLGYMIRHDHVFVLHVSKRAHDFKEIHVTIIWVHLLEIAPAALDIAHMYVKDLIPSPGVADEFMDLSIRIDHAFGAGTETKVESMHWTVRKVGEAFDAVQNIGAVPASDAFESFGEWGISDVVSELDVVFLGYRQEAIK